MTEAQALIAMLSTVAVIYLGTAICYDISGRLGMAIVFLGYAVANIGLILDLRG